MTTHLIPPASAAHLPTGLAAYLADYRPRSLTEVQWEAVREEVCLLTAKTEPVSIADARTVLAALTQFLAWADLALGPGEVGALVTEINVGRYIRHREGSMSDDTREAQRGRLERWLRVIAGDQARTIRQERGAGTVPYTAAERERLADAAKTSVYLSQVLRSGLGAGVVVGEAYAAAEASRGGYTRQELVQAKAAAKAGGVVLDPARLRASWVVNQLDNGRQLAGALRIEGITRRRLDEVLFQLPQLDEAAYRDVLRGKGRAAR